MTDERTRHVCTNGECYGPFGGALKGCEKCDYTGYVDKSPITRLKIAIVESMPAFQYPGNDDISIIVVRDGKIVAIHQDHCHYDICPQALEYQRLGRAAQNSRKDHA